MRILYLEKKFISGIKKIFSEYRFWVITITVSLSSGIVFGQFVIDPYLPLKEHQRNTNIVAEDVNNNFKIMNARIQKIESRMIELSDISAKGEPVGSIISYSGNTAKIPKGWMICDGSALDIPASENDEYYELYSVIGTSWGSGGAGKFLIPNLQGYFLSGAVTLPGVYQNDTIQGHRHKTDLAIAATFQYCSNHKGYNFLISGGTYLTPTNPKTDGSHGSPRFTYESRPKNVSVYYLIKYKNNTAD